MLIRKTLPEDVDTILNIFDTARQFMHATGNRHNGMQIIRLSKISNRISRMVTVMSA